MAVDLYFCDGRFRNRWILFGMLAFAALGLTGLAKHLPKNWGLYCAMAVAALCRALSAPGGNVLLSPACASFDMFQDYEQRGRIFKELVQELE